MVVQQILSSISWEVFDLDRFSTLSNLSDPKQNEFLNGCEGSKVLTFTIGADSSFQVKPYQLTFTLRPFWCGTFDGICTFLGASCSWSRNGCQIYWPSWQAKSERRKASKGESIISSTASLLKILVMWCFIFGFWESVGMESFVFVLFLMILNIQTPMDQ